MSTYQEQYAMYQDAVEQALRALPMLHGAGETPVTDACERPPKDGAIPQPLRSAMAYSLRQKGKRLRPVLLLASYALVRDDWQSAMPFAVAMEMLHTYSLIHDDLPALDNDDLRRGAPTNHKVFGEDMAILAGDALQSAAYELMLDAAAKAERPENALRAMQSIAKHAGVTGMIAGQTLDVKLEGEAPNAELVSYIHRHKTADMMTGAVTGGLLLAGATDAQFEAGARYAQSMGIAFQIEDDLLDVFGQQGELGKTIGKDALQGKMTWPSVRGAEQSLSDAKDLATQADESLALFGGKATFLRELVKLTLVRTK